MLFIYAYNRALDFNRGVDEWFKSHAWKVCIR